MWYQLFFKSNYLFVKLSKKYWRPYKHMLTHDHLTVIFMHHPPAVGLHIFPSSYLCTVLSFHIFSKIRLTFVPKMWHQHALWSSHNTLTACWDDLSCDHRSALSSLVCSDASQTVGVPMTVMFAVTKCKHKCSPTSLVVHLRNIFKLCCTNHPSTTDLLKTTVNRSTVPLWFR